MKLKIIKKKLKKQKSNYKNTKEKEMIKTLILLNKKQLVIKIMKIKFINSTIK